ncbi:hypothetical protein E8K88_14540 [Lampropedia aestuarii]|uniref:Uncharacterized protein n=1 Tax=Lampropedia aestuarii TaxID=2562762 RepID=A0A4S5BGZ2_9BURK|nr:hypothetical protein [Lampropedia aestuarii]MDH5857320.1 hypothetical protein [Lampropedia aestuarii]THJ31530.1 hypothetical protein E8K88_14540 [Lampropedia aestuarii]
MSDIKLGPGLAFDRGIDQITFARKGDTQTLPRREEGMPADLAMRPEVEALLGQPSLDSDLEAALSPHLQHRELLSPQHFRQGLESVQQHLRQAASQLEKEPAQTDALRAVNRASRLLNEECSLRDLVQMYRSVLYQG